MWSILKRIEKIFQQNKLRKEYTQLRLEAIEAKKLGDMKKYLVLDARADRMLDQVIYS
jgi:hypothetical protein